jgi:hypothetical protein
MINIVINFPEMSSGNIEIFKRNIDFINNQLKRNSPLKRDFGALLAGYPGVEFSCIDRTQFPPTW